ncbi:MAG: CysS/YqeB C-terminal domain-containing protein [Candidatus Limnocylindria bacterium]
MVTSRDRARAAKDFATADSLRDEIAERGWAVEDTVAGTQVRRSPVGHRSG